MAVRALLFAGRMMGVELATVDNMHFKAVQLQQTLEARYKPGCAIVAPLWDGPQVRVFSAILKYGVRPSDISSMADALALAAQAESCRVSQGIGQMLIEIAKPKDARMVLRADRLETLPMPNRTTVPLGISTGGKVVTLDLADERQAHVLFGGATGSGKSTELKWVLYRLLAQNSPADLEIIACDPKITHKAEGLRPFAYVPQLRHPIQPNVTEVTQLLTWVMMEIKRRENEGRTTPRLLVVVEEVKHFIDQNKDVQKILAEILQIGRGWGINVLATTQHPGVKSIGDGLSNFLVTVLGRIAREQQAFGAAGRAGSDAATLLGRGDMLYIGAGETIRFQAPYADGRQWVKIKRGMPRDLTAELPRPDLLQIPAAGKGGKPGRVVTPADIDALRPAIRAGRGAEYVRQTLNIGTPRATQLYQQILSEEGIRR